MLYSAKSAKSAVRAIRRIRQPAEPQAAIKRRRRKPYRPPLDWTADWEIQSPPGKRPPLRSSSAELESSHPMQLGEASL